MKNRNMPAKPCQEFNQGHCNTDLSKGLTKLEYAAIKFHANQPHTGCSNSITDSIKEANLLFDQLEQEQENEQ